MKNDGDRPNAPNPIARWLNGAAAYGGRPPGKARRLTEAALIAALYAALTLLFASTSFLPQQLRVSEALTVLPALTPAAVPGLFVGCALINTMSPFGIYDVVFGSLASLIAAALTRMIAKAARNRNRLLRALLLPIPSVLVNTLIIGAMLSILESMPFWAAAASVFTGQALSCYALGVPLYLLLSSLAFDRRGADPRTDGGGAASAKND